jgi:hypothetical protein
MGRILVFVLLFNLVGCGDDDGFVTYPDSSTYNGSVDGGPTNVVDGGPGQVCGSYGEAPTKLDMYASPNNKPCCLLEGEWYKDTYLSTPMTALEVANEFRFPGVCGAFSYESKPLGPCGVDELNKSICECRIVTSIVIKVYTIAISDRAYGVCRDMNDRKVVKYSYERTVGTIVYRRKDDE